MNSPFRVRMGDPLCGLTPSGFGSRLLLKPVGVRVCHLSTNSSAAVELGAVRQPSLKNQLYHQLRGPISSAMEMGGHA